MEAQAGGSLVRVCFVPVSVLIPFRTSVSVSVSYLFRFDLVSRFDSNVVRFLFGLDSVPVRFFFGVDSAYGSIRPLFGFVSFDFDWALIRFLFSFGFDYLKCSCVCFVSVLISY